MKIRPVMYTWSDDEVMVPVPRFLPLCRRQFAAHEDYALGIIENVSGKSRAHLFAAIKDSWDNLPGDGNRFPTPEHFRKWLLVRVGHCTETNYVMDTPKDAARMARALRAADEYAIIVVRENTVLFATAKSIASTAIKHEEFQKVKTAVLDLASSMTGISRGALAKEAGRAT